MRNLLLITQVHSNAYPDLREILPCSGDNVEKCDATLCSTDDACRFCQSCLTTDEIALLKTIYREQKNKNGFEMISPNSHRNKLLEETEISKLQRRYIKYQCQRDSQWC